MSDEKMAQAEVNAIANDSMPDNHDARTGFDSGWRSRDPEVAALTTQLQAAHREVAKTDAAFAALKQQHAASDVALIDAKAIIAEALAVEPVGLAHWKIRRILNRAITPTENGENR